MKKLDFLKNRLSTRAGLPLFSRAYRIVSRYGFGDEKFVTALTAFVKMVFEYDVHPTLPLTACVLNRHPKLFQSLQDSGVEFAIHGFRHVDYTLLSIDEVRTHFHKAIDIFDRRGIRFNGFRFPFLRHDTERMDLLEEFPYEWDSSRAISWDFTSWNGFSAEYFNDTAWQNYKRILISYQAVDASDSHCLPDNRGSLVEIPVSIPDDDILIDRLGFRDGKRIASIWNTMLTKTRQRGDLLALQVHPERFFAYQDGLRSVLKNAREDADIWIASVSDITDWWHERHHFRWDTIPLGHQLYRIIPQCSERTSCMVVDGNRRSALQSRKNEMHPHYWEMEFPVRPVVGLHPSVPDRIQSFIQTEGWATYRTSSPETCSVYFGPESSGDAFNPRSIRHRIESAVHPLLRFGLWPSGYRCALSITGDIDSVNLIDYWSRFYG